MEFFRDGRLTGAPLPGGYGGIAISRLFLHRCIVTRTPLHISLLCSPRNVFLISSTCAFLEDKRLEEGSSEETTTRRVRDHARAPRSPSSRVFFNYVHDSVVFRRPSSPRGQRFSSLVAETFFPSSSRDPLAEKEEEGWMKESG